MAVSTFDLVAQPWIPVVVGGTRVEVSLSEALLRAHDYDGLTVDDPLQTVAVLRQVLLPVVWTALGVPVSEAEWAQWWRAGCLDADRISAYLNEHVGRFDLFHPSRPFAQVAGLRVAKGDTKPILVLQAAAPSGNNVPLFSARTEGDPPPLSPAQAIRALLATQCWDTGAIKSGAVDDLSMKDGKTTGNPTGPAGGLGVIIPIGANLFQTILLNTVFIRQGLRPEDRPQWSAERATPEWSRRPALGLLDLLSWQSRRIRLLPETDEHGQTVVRRVVLTAGDRLDPLPEIEPHTAWRQVDKPKPDDPPRRPIRHQPGKATWQGMAALLATRPQTAQTVTTTALLGQLADLQEDGHIPVDLPLQVLTVGVQYGKQPSFVEDVMVDLMPLPIAALSPESPLRQFLLDITDQADQLRLAANDLVDDLRRACGADKLRWDRGLRLGEALVAEFTPVIRRMLGGLQREPERLDEAEAAWKIVARRLAWAAAEPVLAATPPTAFLGRQESDRVGVRRKSKPVVYRLSLAEDRYRRKIAKALGPINNDQAEAPLAESGAPQ